MAVTGSTINIYCMTVSGDSVLGTFFIKKIHVVFSAGAAGNSAIIANGSNSTIAHFIASGANYSAEWAVMRTVKDFELAGISGDGEVYVDVEKG